MVQYRCAHLQLKLRLSSAEQQDRASWEARMASQEEDQEWWVSDPIPGPFETRLSCVAWIARSARVTQSAQVARIARIRTDPHGFARIRTESTDAHGCARIARTARMRTDPQGPQGPQGLHG